MESTESVTSSLELKPPYGNVAWYKRFLELIKSKSWEKIDITWIESNIIGGPNATMLFRGLRFLGLIEENGKTTSKLEGLRLNGPEFKQNLKNVVEESYKSLFKTVAIEKAPLVAIVNYFKREPYGYGQATAEQAMKIFIYLAQEAGIPLSQELISPKIEKGPKVPRRVPRKEAETKAEAVPTKDIHEIKWGDIRMWLPKGDKKAIATAKDLLDIYLKSLESQETD